MEHLPPKQALEFLQAHSDARCNAHASRYAGSRERPIVLICRSGFAPVYNVEHGFEEQC